MTAIVYGRACRVFFWLAWVFHLLATPSAAFGRESRGVQWPVAAGGRRWEGWKGGRGGNVYAFAFLSSFSTRIKHLELLQRRPLQYEVACGALQLASKKNRILEGMGWRAAADDRTGGVDGGGGKEQRGARGGADRVSAKRSAPRRLPAAGASTFWTAERQEERTDVRMNTSGRASGATEGRARRASSPGEERRGRREIELTIVDGGGPHSGTVIWLPGRGGEPVEAWAEALKASRLPWCKYIIPSLPPPSSSSSSFSPAELLETVDLLLALIAREAASGVLSTRVVVGGSGFGALAAGVCVLCAEERLAGGLALNARLPPALLQPAWAGLGVDVAVAAARTPIGVGFDGEGAGLGADALYQAQVGVQRWLRREGLDARPLSVYGSGVEGQAAAVRGWLLSHLPPSLHEGRREAELADMSVAELLDLLQSEGVSTSGCRRRSDLLRLALRSPPSWPVPEEEGGSAGSRALIEWRSGCQGLQSFGGGGSVWQGDALLAAADEACNKGLLAEARELLDGARTAFEMDGARHKMLVLEGMEQRVEEAELWLQLRANASQSGAWGYGPSVATSAQAVSAIRDRAAAAADGVEPEELRSRRYVRAAFQPGWPFTLSDPDQTPDPPPPSLPGPRGGTRPPPSSSSLAERREEGGRFALGDEEAEAALAMQEMRESALEYKLVSKVQAGWDRLFPGSVDWELGWRLHLTALGVIQQPQLREEAAPLGFIAEASRRVDYLRGLAQDALQNQDYTLARALVAEAKLESSGGDEESRQAVQELAEEVERRCLDQPFDYS